MPYALLALVLVILDQVVKYLVLTYIPLGGYVPFLPHIACLTYVQNTGAAFSMFSQHTWILALISLIMAVVLARCPVEKFLYPPLGQGDPRAAAGRGGGQSHRPGTAGLCGGHVPAAVYELCRVQCGRHLRGGGRHCRRGLLSAAGRQAGAQGGAPWDRSR